MSGPNFHRISFAIFLLASAIGLAGCSHTDSKTQEKPVPTVKVSYPIERDITDYAEYTGRTAAIDQVQIRARVSGYLDKINFKEGAEVKQDVVLYEIDPRPYAATLEQAKAQVSQQKAQLVFQNNLYERDLKLYEKNAEALQQLQQDKATRDVTAAALESAKAQLKTATLNHEWTKVKAPIAGRIGRTLITKGNLVIADQTPLTMLVSQDPMYAYFEADEPTVLHVQQLIRKGELPTIDEGAKVPVYLGLSTEEGFPHKGYLNFVNNQFNLGTATLQLRGKFPNPKPAVGLRLLSPGQFVRVRIPISPTHKALLITQAAVGTDQNEKYAFVVNDQGKVERRALELGAPRPGLQVINKGLATGDRVIIDGLQHVRAGATVNAKVVAMPEEKRASAVDTITPRYQAPPGNALPGRLRLHEPWRKVAYCSATTGERGGASQAVRAQAEPGHEDACLEHSGTSWEWSVFARFFIDRPIFAWVLSLVIILIGGVAIFFLPIDLYPPITPPTVQVSAAYPGSNADEVAKVIAAPIEQQVNGVENMLYMSSQSTNDGSYTLTVTFEIGTDINIAQVLVQNRVALALPQLPAQVQLQGVNTKKTSPNILFGINLVSPDGRYDRLYLSNFATIQLQDELLRIKGVGDIKILGIGNYSMRLWLDPDKLATRGLTATDVVTAITNQNVQVAAGQVGQQPVPAGQQFQFTMSALGRLQSPEQFGAIILKTGAPNTPSSASGDAAATQPATDAAAPQGDQDTGSGAAPVVRVRDVGHVELGAQNYDVTCNLDKLPSAIIAVFQLPGSNALNVGAAVKAKMVDLQSRFPPGLEYRIIYDTTPFIRQSIDEVFATLLIAILLVAAVVLLFLQDWKAMILPMIDVPVSLVGTCAVMALLGFTLNNLTLFGLVLAIGIVVDDAIVVLENIERLIATGLDARAATIKAMDEITGPIVAITLVLSAVFLPTLFIPGLTGQFYRQFAVTIAASMIISALNALTLTPSRAVSIFKTEVVGQGDGHPMQHEALPWWIFGVAGGFLAMWLASNYLSITPADASTLQTYGYSAVIFSVGLIVGLVLGWFIIRPVNAGLGWLFGKFNKGFDKITAAYGWTVAKMLRIAAIVMVAYGGLLFLTWWRVGTAQTGFIPEQDQGYLLANIQLPDAASVQRTQAVMAKIDKIARDIPGVAHTVSIAGESFLLATNSSNLGSMFIVLEPFDVRRGVGAQYDEVIAEKLSQACAQEIEGAIVGVFRSPPIRGLGNAGGFQLQTEQQGFVDLAELQTMTDALVAKANQDPRFNGVFTLYRAHTPQLFVDIDRTKVESLQVPIQDVFQTLQVYMGGLYVNQFNEFGRTWQVQVQADPRFRASAGIIKQFQVRNKQGQMMPLGTLARIEDSTGPLLVMRYNMYTSASVNGSAAPGVSTGTMIDTMAQLAKEADVPFEWTQLTYLQVEAGNVAFLIFGLGTVLVYFILAAKYESWKLPLAVILVVPLCLLAAVTGMAIMSLPVDIFVQIGLLVLVGLASKNAILIVEYARDLHMQNKDIHDAAVDAARIRFRPIIMTSLAFTLGVVPLVLASGAGAEMRQSLGVAVFSGMIGVTLFGVFLTPTFYFVLMWLGRRRERIARQTRASLLESAQE